MDTTCLHICIYTSAHAYGALPIMHVVSLSFICLLCRPCPLKIIIIFTLCKINANTLNQKYLFWQEIAWCTDHRCIKISRQWIMHVAV